MDRAREGKGSGNSDRDTCEDLLARCPGWAELSVINSPSMVGISGDRETVQDIVDTFTERLLTYALGRGLDYYDMPAVRGIVRDAAADDYRFSSIVRGIVLSTAFRKRLKPMTDEDAAPVRSASR